MKTRKLDEIIVGSDAVDGAGVKLVRLFGHSHVKKFDPFLMMDGFDSSDPADYQNGFPWHPHRGIETITYLIDGSLEHRDSLGTVGVIGAGDAQWMNAGSGIIHQEMPKKSDRMRGVQLWLNLPKENKLSKPSYSDILSQNIPTINADATTVKIIAGVYQNTTGAFEGNYVKPCFLDVSLQPGTKFELTTPAEHTLFIYVLEGSITDHSSGKNIDSKSVGLFTKGEKLVINTDESNSEPTRFLLLHAKPLKQDIEWGGPIVMNNEDELQLAYTQLQKGTFITPERD